MGGQKRWSQTAFRLSLRTKTRVKTDIRAALEKVGVKVGERVGDKIMENNATGIKRWPATERPRERLLQNGAKGLSDSSDENFQFSRCSA